MLDERVKDCLGLIVAFHGAELELGLFQAISGIVVGLSGKSCRL